jgi:hypothetical protein
MARSREAGRDGAQKKPNPESAQYSHKALFHHRDTETQRKPFRKLMSACLQRFLLGLGFLWVSVSLW